MERKNKLFCDLFHAADNIFPYGLIKCLSPEFALLFYFSLLFYSLRKGCVCGDVTKKTQFYALFKLNFQTANS